jgi:CspA family cold shock protein
MDVAKVATPETMGAPHPIESATDENPLEIGVVKWFNNAKGWGFISRQDGSDVFVHYSQIDGDGYRTLKQGQEVRFLLKLGPRGQFAEQVTF